MPLFSRTEPDLRSLIAYMHARAEDRGISLHRTKLVKLLYLVDLERARTRRTPLTGVEWVFTHHGPHAEAVIEAVNLITDRELAMPTWKESRLQRGAPQAPDGEEWPASTKATVDRVMDAYAALTLEELLDHVYFHTSPMRGAKRGEPLDMERAREDPLPRRSVPLTAPTPPGDDRLTRWRERALPRLTLDPPGAILAQESGRAREGLRGRLKIAG